MLHFPPARPGEAPQAYEPLNRSPVIGWIFATGAAVSLISAAFTALALLDTVTPFNLGVLVGCLAYSALCGWCWWERRRDRRALLTVGLFAWATITLIGATAIPQRPGSFTVGYLVMPAFLFMITVLGHRRMSLATWSYASAVFVAVALVHLSGLPDHISAATVINNLVIAAALTTLFAAIGDQTAHRLRELTEQSAQVARHYRALFDMLPVAAIVHVDRRVTEFNQEAVRLMAVGQPERLLGLDVADLVPVEQRRELLDRGARAALLPRGHAMPMKDMELMSVDGRPIPVTVTVMALSEDGRTLLSLAVDRSLQNQAQLALRQTQDLLQALFEVSPHSMTVVDRFSGEFLLANPAFAHAIGRAPQDVIGKTAVELGLMNPDQREEMVRRGLQADPQMPALLPLRSEQGDLRTLSLSMVATEYRGRTVVAAVGQDITQQLELQDKLARAKADAEAASRAKSAFLATMSHEIRTPLNGIVGLIDLVQDAGLDEATRRHYLHLMSESAQTLVDLVSDVIDVSRIEAGRLEIVSRDFELGSWLATVQSSYVAIAESKGLALKVEAASADLGWVRGDPIRLRQIVANYLSNALKFTLQGSITLRLQRLDAQRLRMEVQDTGLGMAPENLGRLFKPYAQADSGGHAARSSGLGLSICSQLARLMGGRVGASSESGVGSIFWVELDLPQMNITPTPSSGADTFDRTIRLDGKSILIVDDNRVNLIVARRLLERAGAAVLAVEGGEAALAAVDAAHGDQQPFDAVLMDIQMPGMDGLQALQALRSRPLGRSLPVIAASAAVTTDEVLAAHRAGFDGFVSKPLEVSTLLTAVHQAIGNPPRLGPNSD